MLDLMQSRRMARAVLAISLLVALAAGSVQNSYAAAKKRKGWLGVGVQEMTPSMRHEYKTGERFGLLITEVAEGSPAENADLQEDDVIIEYNGKAVDEVKAFSRLVRNTEPGSKVTLTILRDGESKKIEAEIGKRPQSRGFSAPFGFGKSGDIRMALGGAKLGVKIHAIDDDLAKYFNAKARSGVLILEVEEDSPAEAAGLKPGDIITKVDGESVRDSEDLLEELRDYEPGDEVELEYLRDSKSLTATVELEGGSMPFRFEMFGPGRRSFRFHRPPRLEEEIIIAPGAGGRVI